MSRCFPYPPPGYSLSRATNEALIESIKFQKEKERAKDLHKEKPKELHKVKSREGKEKKEKKEKKKEKKEKRKEKKDEVCDKKFPKSDTVKIDHSERSAGDLKAQFFLKKSEAEAEQLERSSLTEERGQPVTPALPSTSSDSTQNSNKRKRENPSPSEVSRGNGNIIRIRLSSKKPKVDALAIEEKKPCPVIVRADLPIQTKEVNHLEQVKALESTWNRTHIEQQCAAPKSDRDQQICSTSQQQKRIAIHVPVKPRKLTSAEKEEVKYKNLFDNWSPPKLQDEFLEPDLDWLFQSKKLSLNTEKKWRTSEISCSNSYAMQPRAQYLKEADIYTLPFTLPF